jgi:hypothetical protein
MAGKHLTEKRECPTDSHIPSKPRSIFRGVPQSDEFTDGVYRAKAVLADIDSRADTEFGNDEPKITAALTDKLIDLADLDGERRIGAFAAIADFLTIVMQGSVPCPQDWLPLETWPDLENDRRVPPPGSLFFDVNGDPVSVTCDHSILVWGHDDLNFKVKPSITSVRKHGKPITRRKFDAMRAAHIDRE